MYWFATGTPTFLIEKLKASGFDAKRFTNEEFYEEESSLTDYRVESDNPVPLFYQTGYLTIKDFDKEFRSYALTYPNEEVKYGFLKCLAPVPSFRSSHPAVPGLALHKALSAVSWPKRSFYVYAANGMAAQTTVTVK
jgi:hypothetical protein